jgi:hypothetical protein
MNQSPQQRWGGLSSSVLGITAELVDHRLLHVDQLLHHRHEVGNGGGTSLMYLVK